MSMHIFVLYLIFICTAMRKICCILLILLCCTAQRGFAQGPTYNVRGSVADSLHADPLELVSVQLKTSEATVGQYVQLTDSAGRFRFDNVKGGKYELILSSVGYAGKKVLVDVNKNIDLGKLPMASAAHSLSQATVVAEKPVITRNSEKTVFNVAQSPTHQAGTAEDALRNMPGVSVDRNGNISMVGKQGVKVLVDGKPSVLAESNLQAFLKSIPASTIESIELITNPSARYDANGNAGIINIKLKKGKRDGLNGSAQLSYGILNRYGGNAVINYRRNKINLFATYAFNYKKEDHLFNDRRDITIHDSLSHYYQYNPSTEQNLSNSLKAGFDYFINDKNTLTYTFSGSDNWTRLNSNSTGQSMNAGYDMLNKYQSNTYDKGNSYTITNDLNYLKKYDSTERELMVDFSHTYVKVGDNTTLNSLAYDAAGNEVPLQNLRRNMLANNSINNFIFQMNYAEPLKHAGHKIETGLKNETTLNHNDYNVYDQKNGAPQFNQLLSNGFDYLENIAAFYVIYNGAYKEILSYSGVLRSEHTFINSNKSNVDKNYLSLFPSATISANLSKTQNLSLSYSRRVQRPEFRQINNSVIYFDQYSTWQGDPYLTPAFSNIVSLAYNINIKKTMVSLSSENTFTSGQITESSTVDSNRITRGSIINGGLSRTIAGSLYLKSDITKWWSVQMNHVVAWQKFDYKAGVNTGPVSGTYYNLWMSSDFKFWKNTVLNVNGWFNSGDFFPQGKSKPCGAMNVSIKKSFLKDKLTVTVMAQNILNTMKFQWYVNTAGLHTNGSWQNYNRAVVFTIAYRFGSDNKNTSRRELEENSRLGGGGGGKGK